MYKQATEGLAVKHDLDAEHLNRFLESLRSRAIEQAWDNGILYVTQNGQRLSMIENYGTITKQSVIDHSLTYAFQNQRTSQDANNLFKCLESSLTEDALNTLYAEKEMYTLRRGDTATAPAGGNAEERFRDGVLFLWSIIDHTSAKTNATISVIIEQLTNLPSLMTEVNSDINAFNTNVRSLVNSYYSNKRAAYDSEVLLQSLFRAYKQCNDNEFVEYIKRKEQDHEDGTFVFTANVLLETALKQYQTRVQKKLWGEDTPDHKEILNLTAQLQKSHDEFNQFKLTFDKKDKKKDDKPFKTNKGKKGKNQKDGKKKEFLPYEEYRKQRYKEAPQWMKEKPSDLNQEKDVKGKKYFWCEKHTLWQRHKTSECRIGQNKPNQNDAKAKVDDKGKVQFQVTPHTTMVVPDEWQSDF